MAGDWIKIEHSLPDKPEIIRIADICQIDQDAVVGKLIRFWIWADNQSRNGHVAGVTKSFLDRHVYTERFGNALVEVGWLVEDDEGLVIPNFERHNSKTAKQRGLTFKRKRHERVTKESRRSHGKRVTPSTLYIFSSLKEEIRNSCGDEYAESATFEDAWDSWIKCRREINEDPTETAINRTLIKLARWGLSRSIASLNQSAENNWKGLFEPKDNGSMSRAESQVEKAKQGFLEIE